MPRAQTSVVIKTRLMHKSLLRHNHRIYPEGLLTMFHHEILP